MRRLTRWITGGLLLAALVSSEVLAGSFSANQGVSITVREIKVIKITPESLSFEFTNDDWTAGEATATKTDSGSMLRWSTNRPEADSVQIAVEVDQAKPDWVQTFKAQVGTPVKNGGQGACGTASEVDLTTTAQSIVTGIWKAACQATVTYTVTVSVDADPDDSYTPTVKWTIGPSA